MALSRDSSCTTGLESSTSGHEVYELTPLPAPRLPSIVRKSSCRFPDWMSGQWENLVVEGGTLTRDDAATFQSVTSECVQKSYKHNNNRYLIYSHSHW